MIQRLLTSYILRKQGITCGHPEPPPRTVPFAADPHSPVPSELPPTCLQGSKGQQSKDLDVSMAESTVAFGDTMCLHDLDKGTVTPPPCAVSVPIPAEQIKTSSGVLEDPESGALGSPKLTDAGMGDMCSEVVFRSLMHTFALPTLTPKLYAQLECANFQTPHLLRCWLLLYRRVRNKFQRTRLRFANGSASKT